jgi:hypothetical protein
MQQNTLKIVKHRMRERVRKCSGGELHGTKYNACTGIIQ